MRGDYCKFFVTSMCICFALCTIVSRNLRAKPLTQFYEVLQLRDQCRAGCKTSTSNCITLLIPPFFRINK